MRKGNCMSVCHNKCAPVPSWFLKRKLRKLKLDELQGKQLDRLISSAVSARHDRVSARGELHGNVAELLREPEFNREKATEAIRTASDRYIDSATKFINIFGEFYDGLESWQQEKLQSMWQKRGCCGVRFRH